MTRVRHPILRLEVVGPDGERASSHRVFCTFRREAVDVDYCCTCVHCDAIDAEPTPAVVCLVPESTRKEQEVGAVLEQGTIALSASATLDDAMRVLIAEGRRLLPVVDEESGEVVGIVHELACRARPRHDAGDVAVAEAMSRPLVLRDGMSVRQALRVLASAHLREATVVSADGVPLGVFRDVDGLHALFARRGKVEDE